MDNSEGPASLRSDTSRSEAFSDGVLAVIITLLLLEIGPPEHEPGKLLAALADQWPLYLATLTLFAYVAVVWLNHKAAFKRIRTMDRGPHWANLVVLFATALLPFPTAVVADVIEAGNRTDEQTAVGLYALIGALLCVSWLIFFHYLSQHPHLVEEDVHRGFFPAERTRDGAGGVLYAAAGLIGNLNSPLLAMAIFFVLPVFYAITSEGLYELPGVGKRASGSGRRQTDDREGM